jgi:glycine/D-amino acid oxidase-like deaminating enzyme
LTAPHDDQLSRRALGRLANRTLQHLKASFRGADSSRLVGWQVGYRPMPIGGPLVGHLTPDRSVYVAVMHSGVSLAPTVGRLVAQELATGEPVAELRRSHPSRTREQAD